MGGGVRKLRTSTRRKAGMTDVDAVLFDNSRHEFLGERQDRERKRGAVTGFLAHVKERKEAV